MHLSLRRASKVRLRVDAARKLSVLSRRLPPLGQASTLRSRVKSCNVGFAIAVVCNPTASLETSHDILMKSSNVGLFRLSSPAGCQGTNRHVENSISRGAVGHPGFHPIPLGCRAPRPKVSIQSLAKFANFFKRILRREICKFCLHRML